MFMHKVHEWHEYIKVGRGSFGILARRLEIYANVLHGYLSRVKAGKGRYTKLYSLVLIRLLWKKLVAAARGAR